MKSKIFVDEHIAMIQWELDIREVKLNDSLDTCNKDIKTRKNTKCVGMVIVFSFLLYF